MIGEELEKSLGVPVTVVQKMGGAGLIGAGYVAKSKPDGYTLLFLSCSAITEKAFIREVPFDPKHGFSYICQIFDYGYGFVVRPDAPWKTFPEFVEDAKKNPGKLTVGVPGLGSTMHVALAKLEAKIPGFKVNIIPYKSDPVADAGVMGGHIDASFSAPIWVPLVNAGKLRLLAAPQKERFPEYPDVPTWVDLGYGVYARSQAAIVGPAGIPEEIRGRLEQEIKKALDVPKVSEVFKRFYGIKKFTPGKELYKELMEMHEQNKDFIPTLGISVK
jgi:tripartite-type tricarboxylate transporter receptor subunit TctC